MKLKENCSSNFRTSYFVDKLPAHYLLILNVECNKEDGVRIFTS
jgi:hypothetical protein